MFKIKEKKYMNNTVNKEQIDKLFDESEKHYEIYWGKCTVVAIKLKSGFVIIESSACVDPENFDDQVGREICEERIKNKLWELEGYELQKNIGAANAR